MSERRGSSSRLWGCLSICLALVLVLVLAAATLTEKYIGTARTSQLIYSSLWFFLLWLAFGVCAAVYMWQRRLFKRPAVALLHLALAVILIGAGVTHFWGRQGSLHLREGNSTEEYILNGRQERTLSLPFKVSLSDFEVIRYAGSSAPMDYVGKLEIEAGGMVVPAETAMNKVLKHGAYRLYPASYDSDEKGMTLIVSFDPVGRTLTYLGYALLLCGMAAFFFDKKSFFRASLGRVFVAVSGVFFLSLWQAPSTLAAETSNLPKTVSSEVASEFGKLSVSFGDRICPLSSLARDFTVKIYGKPTYRGMSSEQVLLGWYFFYDDWKNEPMIKVKTSEVRSLLQTSGSHTSFRKVELFGGVERLRGKLTSRKALSDAERMSVVELLCGGGMLKIFPYSVPNGEIVWASQIERLPESVPLEQQFFVRNALNYINELVVKGDNNALKETILKIKEYQIKEGGESIPSPFRFKAERLYNHLRISLQLGAVLFVVGLLMYLYSCRKMLKTTTLPSYGRGSVSTVDRICDVFIALTALLLLFIVTLCGFAGGHLPLSNGYETMQFMALCALVLTFLLRRKVPMIRPFGCIAAGAAMMVSMMGEHNPQLTPLRPVLSSPLLSVHVMTIMVSYTLFFFLLLNGVTGLILHLRGRDSESERFASVGTVLLYPAVFLLAAGIFIGAVWADRSWGSYWSWDPKEVWALITLLVYAAALHGGSIPALRKPQNFHIFCIVAFFAVLITYFGVNFFLGGMHSYA